MDNHESHISVESISYAKEHGIILLTIPPHTSHKLQPLDRTVYGPLKSFNNTACDDWMVSHPGRPLTIYEVAECLAKSFPLAFTPRNIQSGFRTTGIWPFNSNIFTEEDFMSSYVTDRENTEVLTPNQEDNDFGRNSHENIQIDGSQDRWPLVDVNQPSTSQGSFKTPDMIRPHPKAPPRKPSSRGRKRGQTKVLTDTPEKLALENEHKLREQKKMEKERRARLKESKMLSKKNLKELRASSSSSENEEILPLSGSELDNDAIDSETDCESLQSDVDFQLAEQDWVVAELRSEKNKPHRYVGQVIKNCNNTYTLKFAKKKDDKTFKWPEKDDICDVEHDQIIKKLPNPSFRPLSKRVGCFVFPRSLKYFNIE